MEESTKTTIAEYSQTEAALAILSEKYKGAVYDVETTSGMRDAKEARADIRRYRIDLETKRKEIKAPALKRSKDIDSEAKRIEVRLRELEGPIDCAIKQREHRDARLKAEKEAAEAKAEAERVARGEAQVAAIKEPLLRMIGKPAVEIFQQIKTTEAIDSTACEFSFDAAQAREAALVQLERMYADAVKRESDQAKMVKLEAEAKEAKRLAFVAEQKDGGIWIAEGFRPPAKEESETHPTLRQTISATQLATAHEGARIGMHNDNRDDRVNNGYDALASFARMYGDLDEFTPVVSAINHFLKT